MDRHRCAISRDRLRQFRACWIIRLPELDPHKFPHIHSRGRWEICGINSSYLLQNASATVGPRGFGVCHDVRVPAVLHLEKPCHLDAWLGNVHMGR